MVEIYSKVYPNGHYLIGVAEGNLAAVYMERKQYPRAEQLYRDALGVYASTLPGDHQNMAIGKVKLGRALLHQKRYAEALAETQAGYDILSKKSDSSSTWLKNAKQDLSEEYVALKQPELAAKLHPDAAKP